MSEIPLPLEAIGDSAESHSTSGLFNIQPTTKNSGYEATLPSAISDIGVVGTQKRIFASLDEANKAVQSARENAQNSIELASLALSFSPSHTIRIDEDHRFTVTHPAFMSTDNPYDLIGTSSRTFTSWEQARDFYLDTRNRNEYPEDAIFALNIGDVTYKFSHLNRFGSHYRLAAAPLELSNNMKTLTDFNRRNTDIPQEATT